LLEGLDVRIPVLRANCARKSVRATRKDFGQVLLVNRKAARAARAKKVPGGIAQGLGIVRTPKQVHDLGESSDHGATTLNWLMDEILAQLANHEIT
jgi:hypothetical protein